MEETVFTKIVRGEIPCNKIYEDEKTLAFLDIKGAVDGHTLVITKKQVEYIWDLDDEDYAAVMNTCKKVASRIKDVLKPKLVGMKVMGEGVPHVHVHLIPFNSIEEYRQSPDMNIKTDFPRLKEIAEKLAF